MKDDPSTYYEKNRDLSTHAVLFLQTNSIGGGDAFKSMIHINQRILLGSEGISA
jgi:hypothetical protein